MSKKTKNLYEFDKFRLDAYERTLLKEKEHIILPPKVFDTLLMLVENQGKVLSKTKMLDEIWEDSFVEESNLSQNIYTLRQKLGKDIENGNFIETVPRRGYRFATPVKKIAEESLAKTDSIDLEPSTEILLAEETQTQIIEEEIIDDEIKEIPQLPPAYSARPFYKSRRFLTGLLLGTFVVFTLGFTGFWFWGNNFSNSNESISDRIKFRQLTDSENVINLTLSPNGKLLAYIAQQSANKKTFHLKDIELNEDVKLDIPENFNADFLKFSPNGNFIYFRNQRGINLPADIYKITRFGGDAKLIAENVWSEFGISNDEKQIAFVRRNTQNNQHLLIVKNLDNDDEKIIAKKDLPEGFALKESPAWATDNKTIFAISRPQKSHISQIVNIDIESGKETILKTPQLKIVRQIVAMPNGKELVLVAREIDKFPQIFKLNIANQNLQRITNDLNWYPKISLSKDGKTLAARQSVYFSNLWLLPDADFAKAKQLTKGKIARDGVTGLEILPDGKVLYVSLADRNRDLWTLDLEKNSRRQLTENRSDVNEEPFISPDGNYIYFVSIDKKTRNIQRMDLNGQNITQITKDENNLFPIILNDGKKLFFLKQSNKTSSIWQKDLPDGKEEKMPVPKNISPDGFLRISPDGKFLAFQQIENKKKQTDSEGNIKVGVISIEDSLAEPKFFNISISRPIIRWTQNSDAFEYVEQTTEGPIIWRQNIFNETSPEEVLKLPKMTVFNFKRIPNSKDLILAQGKNQNDAILITNFD